MVYYNYYGDETSNTINLARNDYLNCFVLIIQEIKIHYVHINMF